MAKIGRPRKRGRKKIYTQAFNKHYNRYKKLYRQKEKILAKRGYEMADPEQLSKAKFKVFYKAYLREMKASKEKVDITKTIVNQQAYEYSHEQFIGFKKALKEDEYLTQVVGLDYKKINEISFRKGAYFDERFWEVYKQSYHDLKATYEEAGLNSSAASQKADYEMRNLYFGSP